MEITDNNFMIEAQCKKLGFSSAYSITDGSQGNCVYRYQATLFYQSHLKKTKKAISLRTDDTVLDSPTKVSAKIAPLKVEKNHGLII